MAIVGAHQMRLRSTAHSSYVLDSFHRHGGILAFRSQPSAFSRQHSFKPIYRDGREGREGREEIKYAGYPNFMASRP
jgi:hypothetical protein